MMRYESSRSARSWMVVPVPQAKNLGKKKAWENPQPLKANIKISSQLRPFSGLIPVSVDLNEVLPLVRSGRLLKNRLYGADRLACPTVDTLLGIDIEFFFFFELFSLIFCRMNAIHRTDIHTSSILYVDARLSIDIGTSFSLSRSSHVHRFDPGRSREKNSGGHAGAAKSRAGRRSAERRRGDLVYFDELYRLSKDGWRFRKSFSVH